MSLTGVKMSEDVWLTCMTHALSTETEEIMGLLLGDIEVYLLLLRVPSYLFILFYFIFCVVVSIGWVWFGGLGTFGSIWLLGKFESGRTETFGIWKYGQLYH